MESLTESIVSLTDNLNEAINELSLSLAESDGLLRVSGRLDSIEEELAAVKLMIAQERQILATIKKRIDPIKGFFLDENSLGNPKLLGKRNSVSFASPIAPQTSPSSSQHLSALMPLSESEFEVLPKYIRGRLPLERVNKFVEDLNKIFVEKYTLLKSNPAKLPFDQRQRYYDWKQGENDETRGKFFITEADLKAKSALGVLKMDQSGRSILTILRQAGRIKESRSPGVVRYIVL